MGTLYSRCPRVLYPQTLWTSIKGFCGLKTKKQNKKRTSFRITGQIVLAGNVNIFSVFSICSCRRLSFCLLVWSHVFLKMLVVKGEYASGSGCCNCGAGTQSRYKQSMTIYQTVFVIVTWVDFVRNRSSESIQYVCP